MHLSIIYFYLAYLYSRCFTHTHKKKTCLQAMYSMTTVKNYVTILKTNISEIKRWLSS